MTTRGEKSCYASLLITLLLAGIFWLGTYISLPFVNSSFFLAAGEFDEGGTRTSVFMLGIAPFAAGFVIVEILSLIIPAGRRIRREGLGGRTKINRCATVLSILLCFTQSFWIALALERIGVPNGAWLVPNPGWTFRLLTCATLTAGAVLIFCIALLISRWGIGNGFCILIAVGILVSGIRQAASGLDSLRRAGTLQLIEYFIPAALALIILFIYFKRMPVPAVGMVKDKGRVNLDLPVFPQGVFPILAAYYILSLYPLIPGFSGSGSAGQPPGFWMLLIGTTVLIWVFSALGVELFSSRERIVYNLPSGVSPEGNTGRLVRNQAIRSAVVLTAISGILVIMNRQFERIFLPDCANLIILAVIALDVIEQWRFSSRHGRSAVLIELDNSHLASYLGNLLESNGVDAVVQAYQYRRLQFFLAPLIKMRILVAPEDCERARELIARESIRIL
jgi:preprotein translocase subunit SecY